MLYLAAVCLFCAIIAAIIGFALLGEGQPMIARIFFGLFLLLSVAAMFAGAWHLG